MAMMKPEGSNTAIILISSVVTFIIWANSCQIKLNCGEGSHRTMSVVNNSDISVNCVFEDSHDSILVFTGQGPSPEYGLIKSKSSDDYAATRDACWEEGTPAGTYRYLFIFDHDTVVKYGWLKISGTEKGLLKKVRIDIDFLKSNNFTVTYP
jgi:hypothetical protein